jgi:hypothetical protein
MGKFVIEITALDSSLLDPHKLYFLTVLTSRSQAARAHCYLYNAGLIFMIAAIT